MCGDTPGGSRLLTRCNRQFLAYLLLRAPRTPQPLMMPAALLARLPPHSVSCPQTRAIHVDGESSPSLAMLRWAQPTGSTAPRDLDHSDARWLYNRMTRLTHACKRKQRMGGTTMWGRRADGSLDGEWWVCMDQLTGGGLRDPCVAYSFGIGSDWSFEEAIASGVGARIAPINGAHGALSRLASCQVHAFDPTMGLPVHIHQPGGIRFQPAGLGASDGRMVEPNDKGIAWTNGRSEKRWPTMWKMVTISSLMRSLGHKRITLLKVDTEGMCAYDGERP